MLAKEMLGAKYGLASPESVSVADRSEKATGGTKRNVLWGYG